LNRADTSCRSLIHAPHSNPTQGASLRGYSPRMNLPDLEIEALKLSIDERARLAETLLKSLDALSEEEHRRI
jgi:hypothetical protein